MLWAVAPILTVSFFILIALVPFAGAQSTSSHVVTEGADASLRRLEVGGQVADIRTGCIGQPHCSLPSFGLGAGASLNLNPHFAVDANYNKTPESGSSTNIAGGNASEFLLGARAEVRARHYGFFVKAQPGYLRWSSVITGVISAPTPTAPFTPFNFSYGTSIHFASALGGGFEYSPNDRIHLRAEVSDLLVSYSATTWNNNLQPSIGIYAGLGRPIYWRPPVYRAETAHSFRDAPNSVLFLGSVLAMTADAVTTQRFISHGVLEGDPFARPLVKYGWSGQISAMSLEVSAEVVAMYALHRIGQHWLERLVPVGLATTHGIFAYKNAQLSFSTPAN
jgi:hypothetical protein